MLDFPFPPSTTSFIKTDRLKDISYLDSFSVVYWCKDLSTYDVAYVFSYSTPDESNYIIIGRDKIYMDNEDVFKNAGLTSFIL